MTHPFDRLSVHRPPECDDPDPIGTEVGDECGRYHEPDEEARGKPRPCTGTMTDEDGVTVCDICGEIG